MDPHLTLVSTANSIIVAIAQPTATNVQEEEKQRGDFKFKEKDMIREDGELHLGVVYELLSDICFSFRDICRYADTIVNAKTGDTKHIIFTDTRGEKCLKNWQHALFGFIREWFVKDLQNKYGIPSKMIANTLLALYEDLALDHQKRGHLSSKGNPIKSEKAASVPVLILGRVPESKNSKVKFPAYYIAIPGYDTSNIHVRLAAFR